MINVRFAVLALVVCSSACTIGREQDFEISPGFTLSNDADDVLFVLTNRGGNAPEVFDSYRVELGDKPIDAALYGTSDRGDAMLELTTDGITPGVVDPGDVLRVREYSDGMNLSQTDNGSTLWINVMVLEPGQETSDALTRSWGTVWSMEWTVGT
jgi:hypothetical protein